MRISRFANERDNTPRHSDLEWPDLVALLATHDRRDQKSGPAWSPTEFLNRRANTAAIAVHALVYDLDHLDPASSNDVLTRVDQSGHAAILHSTHSHVANAPSFRLVLQTSRPMTPLEFPRVWETVRARLGLPADEAARDVARLYYLPSAPFSAPTEPVGVSCEGTPIDVDATLASAFTAPTAPTAQAASPQPSAPQADEPVEMDDVRKALRRSRNAFVLRALAGEPMEKKGNRDNALQEAIGVCAWHCDAPFEAVWEIVRVSVESMEGEQPIKGWEADARFKFDRSRERRAEHREKQKVDRDIIEGSARKDSSLAARDPDPGRGSVHEDDEARILRWVKRHGVESKADFSKRWVIQRDGSFYIFTNGRYTPPVTQKELRTAVVRDLAFSGLDFHTNDKQNNPRVSLIKLAEDFTSVASGGVIVHLDEQESRYDVELQQFHEAAAPLRIYHPVYHPDIDEWIDLLGGEPLRRWVAAVSRLDRQAAALYLDGPKGIGKTLIANGLARLWTMGGPSEIANVLDGFNDSLCRCPLIFADEALPNDPDITAKLRRMIGQTERTLNRKFLPTASLVGAVRLLIAGNNDRLLDSSKELSANDQSAVAGRFLYVNTDDKAAALLKKLGGPPAVNNWIKHDSIAQHALYLRDTVQLDEGARFLVEGNEQEFHDHLAVSTKFGGLVTEWLVKWLADAALAAAAKPSTVVSITPPWILAGSGELWVNPKALGDEHTWSRYIQSEKIPSATKAANALRNISTEQIDAKINGQTVSYFVIKVSIITSQITRLLIADEPTVRARLAQPNEHIERTRGRGQGAAIVH